MYTEWSDHQLQSLATTLPSCYRVHYMMMVLQAYYHATVQLEQALQKLNGFCMQACEQALQGLLRACKHSSSTWNGLYMSSSHGHMRVLRCPTYTLAAKHQGWVLPPASEAAAVSASRSSSRSFTSNSSSRSMYSRFSSSSWKSGANALQFSRYTGAHK